MVQFGTNTPIFDPIITDDGDNDTLKGDSIITTSSQATFQTYSSITMKREEVIFKLDDNSMFNNIGKQPAEVVQKAVLLI